MTGPGPTEPPLTEPQPTEPPLTEAARSVYEAARTVAGAWGGNFTAIRRLLAADIALARTALIHGLVRLLAAAILFGTAWVLLTALSVWGLHQAGFGWGFAIGVPMLVSVALGAFAMWHAKRVLRHADLNASRRQLTLWFGTLEEIEQTRQGQPVAPPAGAQPDATATGTRP